MQIRETQLVQAILELREGKMLGTESLSKAVRLFLARKRLMKRSGKVLRALEKKEAERAKEVTVRATLAHAPSSGTKTIIETKAQELFGDGGRGTRVVFREDPAVLGGVRLEANDSRFDFSLSRSLQELHKSLSQ